MQVFLQPVDTVHYEDTILKGRSIDALSSLNQKNKNALKDIFGNEQAYIWGVESNKALGFWKKIEKDNAICIFYKSGKLIGLGKIVYTLENSNLGKELWGSRSWKGIYFIKDFEEINLSIKNFNAIVGSKYDNVKGFQKINNERANIIIDNLSLFSKKITQADTNIPDGITEEMVRTAVNDYNNESIIHTFKDSRDYDVIIDGNRYPPKAIIGIASSYIIDRVLLPSEFSAGYDKKCFKILIGLGFRIIPKAPLPSLDSLLKEELKKRKKAKNLSTDILKDKLNKKKNKRKNKKVNKKSSTVYAYARDSLVVEYANRRADGICDLCEKNAPFMNKDNIPFLEVHHIKQLAKGGDDWIDNVAALCPNCHRKMHIVNDVNDVKKLKKKALIEL